MQAGVSRKIPTPLSRCAGKSDTLRQDRHASTTIEVFLPAGRRERSSCKAKIFAKARAYTST